MARPTSRTRTRRAGGGLARGPWLRVLLAAAAGPLVTGYAVVAALLAVVSALAPRSQFSAAGVLWAAGPGWLAAHQVPLEIDGAPLGVLPLFPTVAACVLVARTASGAAQRLAYHRPGEAARLAGLMAAAHGGFGLLFVATTAGTPVGVAPVAAVIVPALFAGGAALAGLARPCGLVVAADRYLDPLAKHGLRAGALGMAGLLAAATATLGIGMLVRASTVHQLFVADAPGVGAGIGMVLLSVGYLPNAIGMALGFTTGPGFSFGEVTVSPFGYSGGAVPGIPLLGAIPDGQAFWWPLFLLLPLGIGTLVGWSLRRCHDSPMTRLRVVGVAAVLVGFGTVMVSTLAGGALGAGGGHGVSVSPGFASIAAFAWIAVPGGLVAWFAGPRAEPEPEPEPEPEIDDEEPGSEIDEPEPEPGEGAEYDAEEAGLEAAPVDADEREGP